MNAARSAFLAMIALAAGAGGALAGDQPSAAQIIQALKPPKLTRGLSAPPPDSARAAEDARFVDGLRTRTTRSLSTDERQKISEISKTRPSIDLEINFEYNSAVVNPKALEQVTALGEALSSPDLKGSTFVLAGHTDAKGGETYNQGLSERRAEAVRNILQEKYGVEVSHMLTAGYGKSQLKLANNPYAAENRRVQVINVADK
jgi:outer membrane protein OmpA-like peptidoglycan-associated protein